MSFLIALIPSLLWGSNGVIVGWLNGAPRQRNLGIQFGGALGSFALLGLLGPTWGLQTTLIGILCGLLWSAGSFFLLRALPLIGLSRATPLTTSIQMMINAVVGVLFFGEWGSLLAKILGGCALALFALGAFSCSWSESDPISHRASARRAGIANAVASAFFFGSYPPILTATHVPAKDAIGPMGIGLFIAVIVMAVAIPRDPQRPVTSVKTLGYVWTGSIWAVGNVILLRSTASAGVATGFVLSQLGFVIATIGGVFILGEHRTRREGVVATIGVIAVLVGVTLLGIAAMQR